MTEADSSWPAARVRRGGLTALWIAERLQQSRLPKSQRLRKSVESSLTLVLVPSLSLVQQNLAEWGRHSTQDFDTLVVCSDESVVQRNEDTVLQSTADLGVKVTTKPAEIQQFLEQHRKRPAVVFNHPTASRLLRPIGWHVLTIGKGVVLDRRTPRPSMTQGRATLSAK